MSNAQNHALQLKNIYKTYSEGQVHLPVLQNVSLQLAAGELVALVGPSGAGKSTLLHVAGLLDKPDRGEVWLAGQAAHTLPDKARTFLRGQALGFVYQFHHLLPEFTAQENIILPQRLIGINVAAATKRADFLLEAVGLSARATHRPAELSGGERQRVAIARALANKPKLLLADEPTGNLDPSTAAHVFGIFKQLAAQEQLAVLMATHNMDLAHQLHRIVHLANGCLHE